jgi:hypothetical protein
MQLDNDLLGIWLKAETLMKEEIRFLIETIQTQRNQLDCVGRAAPMAVEARLRELATMPRDRPPLADRPSIFALGDYFTV